MSDFIKADLANRLESTQREVDRQRLVIAALTEALEKIDTIACRVVSVGTDDVPESANRDGEELACVARAAIAKARGGE